MNLQVCPVCGTRVWPSPDGTCPSCRRRSFPETESCTAASPSLVAEQPSSRPRGISYEPPELPPPVPSRPHRPTLHCKCGLKVEVTTGIGGVIQGGVKCPKCRRLLTLDFAILSGEPASAGDRTADEVDPPAQASCCVCGKVHDAQAIPLFPLALSDGGSYSLPVARLGGLLNPLVESPFVWAWICVSCGAAFCPKCAKKRMSSRWSGMEKASCTECGQPFRAQSGIGVVPPSHREFVRAAAREVTCEGCSEKVAAFQETCKCGRQMFPARSAQQRLTRSALAAVFLVQGLGLGGFTVWAFTHLGGGAGALGTGAVMVGAVLTLSAMAAAGWQFRKAWTRVPPSGLFLRRASQATTQRPAEAADDVVRALLCADVDVPEGPLGDGRHGPFAGLWAPFAPDPLAEALRTAAEVVLNLHQAAPNDPAVHTAARLMAFHQ